MKFLIAFAPFFLAASLSHASEISCEQNITTAVQQSLAQAGSPEVITAAPLPRKHLENVSLFTVTSSSAYAPNTKITQTTWAALVKMGEQNTCQVLDVVQDHQIQM